MKSNAKIFRRLNGQYGVSVGTLKDAPYHIAHADGLFTATYDGEDDPLVSHVSRSEAERAIALDYPERKE